MARPRVRAQHRRPPAGSPRAWGRRDHPPPQSNSSNNVRENLTRKLADKPVGARPEDSDDSDRLVTKRRGGGRRARTQEVYLSGAVGPGDKPGSHPTRAQRIKCMANALRSSRSSSVGSGHAPVERPPSAGAVSQSPTTTATNGVVPTARETPARDGSILGGFKPRKRQLSVLHVASLDSSGLALSNDSFALPDDESTPAQVPARKLPNSTPLSSDSSARKRKLSSVEPLSVSGPLATPSLISDTSTSGAKRRRQTLHADPVGDDTQDIMAPPMSSTSSSSSNTSSSSPRRRSSSHRSRSSSPLPSSPVRPTSSNCLRKQLRSSATAAPTPSGALITTQQLQALMPSKRHRLQPARANASQFDIPSDSSCDPASEPDESFLPSNKRRGNRASKKPQAMPSSSSLPSKGTAPKRKSKSKPKPKPKPKPRSEATLQPTRASRTNIKTTTRSNATSSAAKPSLSSVPKQLQGSFLGGSEQPDESSRMPTYRSSCGAQDQAKPSGGSRLGSCVSSVAVVDDDDNDHHENHYNNISNAEAAKENTPLESVFDRGDGNVSEIVLMSIENKPKSKWDEIDAFDLQFEDVSVYDRSSEGEAR